MPAFARIHKPAPIPLFELTWRSSRNGLEHAYNAAFAAAERRNEFLGKVMDLDEASRLAAFSEDVSANLQSSVVLLVADDALQRLGNGVLGKPLGLKRGFGREIHGVPLTMLLRAITNCIRHASEWDDTSDLEDGSKNKLHFPYDDARNASKTRELDSIRIIQQVTGYGKTERISTAPCFDVLLAIDGQWYSGRNPQKFELFESAVLEAAQAIIEAGQPLP